MIMAEKQVKTLHVSVVAARHPVWEGDAKFVVIPSVNGTMGVLPGHEAVLALIDHGFVKVDDLQGVRHVFKVTDGFYSVDNNHITIAVEHSCNIDKDGNVLPNAKVI